MNAHLSLRRDELVADFSLPNLLNFADALADGGHDQLASCYRILAGRFRSDPRLLEPWTQLLFKEQARVIGMVASMQSGDISADYRQRITDDRVLEVRVMRSGQSIFVSLQLEPLVEPAPKLPERSEIDAHSSHSREIHPRLCRAFRAGSKATS